MSTNIKEQVGSAPALTYQTPSIPVDTLVTNLFFRPEVSWLDYQVSVVFIEDDRVIRHKPLAGSVRVANPEILANRALAPTVGSTASPKHLLASWDVPDIFQRVCSPDTNVALIGSALRCGYRIEIPRLVRFGKRSVIQTAQRIEEKQVGRMQGIIIYGAAWRIEYALGQPIAGMDTMIDPMQLLHGKAA